MTQRDPLVEYQREGFDMFNSMMDGIKEESVGNLFNLQFEAQENPIVEEAPGAAPGAATAAPPAAAVQAAAPEPPLAGFGAPAGQAGARRGGPGPGRRRARGALGRPAERAGPERASSERASSERAGTGR